MGSEAERPLTPFVFDTNPPAKPHPGWQQRREASIDRSRRLYARPRPKSEREAVNDAENDLASPESADLATLRERRQAIATRIGMRGTPGEVPFGEGANTFFSCSSSRPLAT
jgi:hypothetical protein